MKGNKCAQTTYFILIIICLNSKSMDNNKVNRVGKMASQMDGGFPCLTNAGVRAKRVSSHRRMAAIYNEVA